MGNKSRYSKKSKRSLSPRGIDVSSNSDGTHLGENKKTETDTTKSANDENVKSNSGKAKKMRSLEDLVKAMKPSAQELEYRKKKPTKSDYTELFRCTKCNSSFNIGSDKNGEVQEHPCLGVLMCKKCCEYYNDGEFSLDSESEDKYCRWCGEGGTLFGCSKCICGFCTTCINKHFGQEYLKKVEMDDDWLCFFCDPKPLWDERYICFLALEMSKKEISTPTSSRNRGLENQNDSKIVNSKKGKQTKANDKQDENESNSSSVEGEPLNKSLKKTTENNSRKRIHYSSSDESVTASPKKRKRAKLLDQEINGKSQNENFETLKQEILEKLEKAIKSSEYQLAFGMKWSSKMLKKLADPKHIRTPDDLREQCQKVKWFLSTLSACLIDFCNSVDSAEKSLPKGGPNASTNLPQPPKEATDFSTIIKFLSFITNQVKTFMKKGFSLTDVLEAEIYDNTEFIGLKKNSKPSTGTTSERSRNVSLQINEKVAEEQNADKDESVDEDSSKLVVDQGSEVQEGDGECMDGGSGLKKDEKKDILQILQILEHA